MWFYLLNSAGLQDDCAHVYFVQLHLLHSIHQLVLMFRDCDSNLKYIHTT